MCPHSERLLLSLFICMHTHIVFFFPLVSSHLDTLFIELSSCKIISLVFRDRVSLFTLTFTVGCFSPKEMIRNEMVWWLWFLFFFSPLIILKKLYPQVWAHPEITSICFYPNRYWYQPSHKIFQSALSGKDRNLGCMLETALVSLLFPQAPPPGSLTSGFGFHQWK